MEINTQQINPLHSITPAHPVAKDTDESEQNNKTQDASQNSNSTLNLSGEALKQSTSSARNETLQITGEKQAQQSVDQIKQSLAENPELVQQMLGGNLTPDLVTRLIS